MPVGCFDVERRKDVLSLPVPREREREFSWDSEPGTNMLYHARCVVEFEIEKGL